MSRKVTTFIIPVRKNYWLQRCIMPAGADIPMLSTDPLPPGNYGWVCLPLLSTVVRSMLDIVMATVNSSRESHRCSLCHYVDDNIAESSDVVRLLRLTSVGPLSPGFALLSVMLSNDANDVIPRSLLVTYGFFLRGFIALGWTYHWTQSRVGCGGEWLQSGPVFSWKDVGGRLHIKLFAG
ncbi:uncharacterized protein BT62DRAFT_924398 [Guyanagaster necrorhizus]|uniref:Uncharacterized protein n=1 Tax=Guyanagaster necrorhizus TaxID=856835 RepID=A0A9P8ALM9_9AGAR|nr:uncharacterized protein BT62DRAFT_924398 [Guyanagaster necrorhizus MCA 3950]KAG7439879.1 hypothetical protein BT62DRAFT_924398 [Guyanagaster necrorhizus MCA 3950]